ncbi:hypothetical protein BDV25DRAFT_118499 [Aspergillus avenaceus]|uniref:tRNA (uracil-O(2)-)-methyltransferase n=1 Tax=Aspergillus avenaceus TaxID=36643 RepID=A0A5N6TVA5_ASPAV|nr:hypothetical protein BDV25DRAFT_118499 [Aspergillus avenaceus]
MRSKNSRSKNPRDTTKLSGKPLKETCMSSCAIYSTFPEEWVTSPDLIEEQLSFTPEVMIDLTVFLLGNININSAHLFRADILYDSLGMLSTPQEAELSFARTGNGDLGEVTKQKGAEVAEEDEHVEPLPATEIPGFNLTRTVVRRFIPRNPNLDRPLEQSCYFYEAEVENIEASTRRFLAVYKPHALSQEEMPYYHPILRSLAFLYDYTHPVANTASEQGQGILSIHFHPYSSESLPDRLERTLHSLLNTQIRLARNTKLSEETPEGSSFNPNKDNVIPRHMIQNTYARIKFKYAADLCRDWAEDTEPSKHVFEDLAITAFLIELWRSMYGAVPADERKEKENIDPNFPGFVDMACGNGVLVYVLLMEGYQGWGFDARRRKTWAILPEFVQERLKEEIYIPKPFADKMIELGREDELHNLTVKTHTGMFPKDTFIISNHADELTVWTPLMATLACPESPLPFIAIPCCSHALSGAKFRYPPPKGAKSESDSQDGPDSQPASGDLNALRKAKQEAQTEAGFYKSMYGSLTAKAMSVGQEIGYDVEKTLLRIPSTRNMAVLGGRKRATDEWRVRNGVSAANGTTGTQTFTPQSNTEEVMDKAMAVVERECARDGGLEIAAKNWIDRAKTIHKGQGMGNQKGH